MNNDATMRRTEPRSAHAAMPRFAAPVALLVFISAFVHSGEGLAQACGSLQNGYGPFDVRHVTGDQATIVEKYHFSADVEQLKHGMTSSVGGDLTYTLRALPNHPRALWAMVRLARREGVDKPRGSEYTVDCWFDRAVRFAPDDGEVRLLFGLWLASKGRKAAATQQLDAAQQLINASDQLKDDPNMSYNLGLGFFEVGRYDDAVACAKRARALGFPLNGLENKLRRANKWPG